MLELNEESVKEFVKQSGKVVVKACASDGKCGYCDQFCPTFELASKEFPDVKFASILVPVFKPTPSEFKRNYMKKPAVDGRAEFYGTPCTILFENGEHKGTLNGNVNIEVLKAFIATGIIPPPPAPRTIQQMQTIEIEAALYRLVVQHKALEAEITAGESELARRKQNAH